MAFFDTSNFFQPSRQGWGLHLFVSVVSIILCNVLFWVYTICCWLPSFAFLALPDATSGYIAVGVFTAVWFIIWVICAIILLVFVINLFIAAILFIIWTIKFIQSRRQSSDDNDFEIFDSDQEDQAPESDGNSDEEAN